MNSIYSVGQVNTYIKNMFNQDFMLNKIYIKGEVSNCKYHTSGHIYFSLKDETGTLSCVMFAGQRKGLGLSLGRPAFVLEIRPETNEVVIGTNEDSMSYTLRANQLNFMSVSDLDGEMHVFAKIRYNHKGAWCTVKKISEDEVLCTFDEPQRAITPGQAVVFYDDEHVVGGGTIIGV